MEFFPEVFLSEGQAEVIARGLFAVARAEEGVHERELAMIRMFYGDNLARLESSPDLEGTAIAMALNTPDLAQLFIKSCWLVAWADGKASDKERALISGYAKALELPVEKVAGLEQSVKEYLIAQLAPLANVDAVRKVAASLDV